MKREEPVVGSASERGRHLRLGRRHQPWSDQSEVGQGGHQAQAQRGTDQLHAHRHAPAYRSIGPGWLGVHGRVQCAPQRRRQEQGDEHEHAHLQLFTPSSFSPEATRTNARIGRITASLAREDSLAPR